MGLIVGYLEHYLEPPGTQVLSISFRVTQKVVLAIHPKMRKFFKSHWHLPLKSPVGFLASANEQQVIQHPSHAEEPALPCTCSPRNIDFQSLSS